METKIIAIFVLLSFLVIPIGCATHRVSMDMAKDIRDSEGILKLFGNPDCVTRTQNGYEEWIYSFNTFNIFTLEYIQQDYRYLLTREGEVIEKNLIEFKSKRRLMPLWELSIEFDQFK
jgi:hypothetical protein